MKFRNAKQLAANYANIRAMKRGYVVALLVIAIISIASFGVLHSAFQTQSRIINVKTLLQEYRILLYQTHQIAAGGSANALESGISKHIEVQRAEADLRAQLPRLQQSFDDLCDEIKRNEIYFSQNNLMQLIQAPPYRLEQMHRQLVQYIQNTADPTLDAQLRHQQIPLVALVLHDEGLLMRGIKVMQSQLTNSAQQSEKLTKTLLLGLIILAVIVLLLEGLYIFRPLVRKVSQDHVRIHQMSQKLSTIANQDALTQVHNRHAFLQSEQFTHRDDGAPLALIMLDLTDFKLVNDIYGYATGDQLLRQFAERLEYHVHPSHRVYRLGGDEFVIVTDDLYSSEAIRNFSMALRHSLRKAYQIEKESIICLPSIGCSSVQKALFSSNIKARSEQQRLLREAEFALKNAKKGVDEPVSAYSQADFQDYQRVAGIATDIHQAIKSGALEAHFQPILSISGAVMALEVMPHWLESPHPHLSKAQMIEIMERNGISITWVQAVLASVVKLHNAIIEADLKLPKICINLPESVLINPNLDAILRHGLATDNYDWLGVEVRENVLLHRNPKAIISNLQKLEAQGAVVCLDDFGSIMTTLDQLHGFPAHSVKITQSFIDRIGQNASSNMIVEGIIKLAKGLEKMVIAGGVCNQMQYDWLVKQDVDATQGSFCGPILDKPEVIDYLATQKYVAGIAQSNDDVDAG